MTKSDSPHTYVEIKHLSYWIWIILGPTTVLMWVGAYIQIIEGRPFGSKPANDVTLLILWFLFGVIVPLLFYIMKFKIELNHEKLNLEFSPLYKKQIAIKEIESLEAVSVSPLRDFGGWGIRINKGKTGIIVKGKNGVEVRLRNREIYVIVTPRSEELYQLLRLVVGT